MKLSLMCGAIAGFVLTTSAAHCNEYYTGSVLTIEDGDTFTLRDPVRTGEFRIRLCGIDAPERGQPGAREAHEALAKLVSNQTVKCLQTRVQVGKQTPCDGRSQPTNQGRIVAQCFVGETDVAAEMVRARHACAWPKFSGQYYLLDPSTCVRPD